MNISLVGKSALVCGSTQGIGKASAIELARLGARITLLARNQNDLDLALIELGGINNLKNDFILADFLQPNHLHRSVENYVNENGGFDILVNNTGGPPAGTVTQAKTEEFLQAFSSHLICNHLITTALLPGMKSNGFGRIINIISTSVKQPLRGLGVSNTIRAAVANWAKTLSVEVAPFGITVNNVLPGATNTWRLQSLIKNKSEKTGRSIEDIEKEMLAEIPASRFAAPEEIASAVAFLATPAAAYINGINLPVDGGRTGCL
jgi:3-oxoacyl-[acyl-carrier protein] reductase